MALGHARLPDVVSGAPDADPDGVVGCESARLVADAVLYEGYLLYPYRMSSEKNRVRWQFGVLAPRDWIESRGPVRDSVAGSADTWRQRTECLVEAGPTARLRVRLRFLQLQHRSVQRRGADGGFLEVGELEVDGRRHLTFDEAVPQEFDVAVQLDAREHTELITVSGGEDTEPVGPAADGHVVAPGGRCRRASGSRSRTHRRRSPCDGCGWTSRTRWTTSRPTRRAPRCCAGA